MNTTFKENLIGFRWIVILIVVFFVWGKSVCQAQDENDRKDSENAGVRQSLTVMTFNVQNLFDARNEEEKRDFTYLPLSRKQNKEHRKRCRTLNRKTWREQCLKWDWSPDVVREKMKRIARVILQSNDGHGPDLVLLQEVENQRILNTLRKRYLKPAKYREAVLIEGDDYRGIDNAILSRLPLAGKPELQYIPFQGAKIDRERDSRGILKATFYWPEVERFFTVFNVHLPSPYYPRQMRRQSLQYLNQLKKHLPGDRPAIAGGDFNIPRLEEQEYGILRKTTPDEWLIAHLEGCAGCRGTSYYPPKKSWSFLDQLHFSKGDWELKQVQIPRVIPEQTNENGRPARFRLTGDPPSKPEGVSDHWPLMSKVEMK